MRARLGLLKAGLDVGSPPAAADENHAALDRWCRELFVLTPYDRSVRRRTILQSLPGGAAVWEARAAKFRKAAPASAALAPELIDELAEQTRNAQRVRKGRKQVYRERRQPQGWSRWFGKGTANSSNSWVYIVIAVLVAVSRLASIGDHKPAAQNINRVPFAQPVDTQVSVENKVNTEMLRIFGQTSDFEDLPRGGEIVKLRDELRTLYAEDSNSFLDTYKRGAAATRASMILVRLQAIKQHIDSKAATKDTLEISEETVEVIKALHGASDTFAETDAKSADAEVGKIFGKDVDIEKLPHAAEIHHLREQLRFLYARQLHDVKSWDPANPIAAVRQQVIDDTLAALRAIKSDIDALVPSESSGAESPTLPPAPAAKSERSQPVDDSPFVESSKP